MLRLLAILLVLISTHNNNINLHDFGIAHQYGTVIEKTVEGGTEYNDYYIVELDDGNLHEVEADDLEIEDRVTVYFFKDEPIRVLYGGRACG